MSEKLAMGGKNPSLKFKIDWHKFLTALVKSGVNCFANPSNIGSDVVDLAASVGFPQTTPASLAWLLINRALIRAMLDIAPTYCEEWKQLTAEEREQHNSHLLSLIPLDGLEIEIDRNFLEQPQTFIGLPEAQKWMESWLNLFVENSANAQAMSSRLPSYFTCALHDELRDNRDTYQLLTAHFADTLVSDAYQREMGWRRYMAWLDKQLDEPIFAETFGIRPLYVPLCAYYIQPQDSDISGSLATNEIYHARDLESAMDEWLVDSTAPSLRLISGGPGSGKSTFTKWWAAQVADRGNFKVWHLSLNHLNFTGDLEGRLKEIAKRDHLHGNPLDEPKILIIFDGLDELALSGKVGFAAAENFIKQLCSLINTNQHELKVLVSGREAIVQSQIDEFSQQAQIWYLLPYYLSEKKSKEYQSKPQNLLEVDRRNEWWQKYGQWTGKPYTGLPQKLRIASLTEITTQPILNYLVAISDYFQKDEIDKKTTRNEIYQSLFKQVYERGWAPQNKANGLTLHPTTTPMNTSDEFQLVLEEVGLCAWHGDGRKVTEAAIITHCKNSSKKVDKLFSHFSENTDANNQVRITRLLMAFYFQARGEDRESGDKTFEFTHKSFGEFLTAKRLVRAIEYINQKYHDDNDGWTEKQSLKYWLEICKSGTLDFDILEFIRQEISLKYHENPNFVIQWQKTCCELIGYLLRSGLPMEELGSLTFYQMNNRAIQAEISLLAIVNACAMCTKKLSKIDWVDAQSFGTWLDRMQGQRKGEKPPLVTTCLSWLDLHEANLNMANLNGAVLNGANLVRASLDGANLDGANLDGANLDGANLDRASLVKVTLNGTSLVGANLDGVRLDSARLNGAILDSASLEEARLDGASLIRASLNGAHLVRANLKGANLRGACFDGANLKWARLIRTNLSGVNLDGAYLTGARLDEAILDRASLNGTNLSGANLDRASLNGAILDGAYLNGANLNKANLEGASLKWAIVDDRTDLYNIVWNGNTKWENVKGLESVKNLPQELKKQLRVYLSVV